MRNKNVVCCIIVVMGYALFGFSLPGRAQEQTLKTLELVRTYNSEEELRAAHPELFPVTSEEHQAILDDGEYIIFKDPESGEVLNRLKKGVTKGELKEGKGFTPEELARIVDPENTVLVEKTMSAYWSFDDEYLMVTEYVLEMYNILEESHAFDGRTRRRTLYNKSGQEVVTSLPLDANKLEIAPDNQSFVAYNDDPSGEWDSEFLYFYGVSGELLAEYSVSGSFKVLYSSNSNYLGACSYYESDFYMFARQGTLIFEGNVRDYTPDNLKQLFVSGDGQYMLLDTDRWAILLDHTGKKLGKFDSKWVRHTKFILSKNLLLLHHKTPEQIWVVKVISLDAGTVLDEIVEPAYVALANDTIYLKEGENFYEYIIK